MAHKIKTPAKSDDQSSVPTAHMAQGENNALKLSYDFPAGVMAQMLPTSFQKINKM